MSQEIPSSPIGVRQPCAGAKKVDVTGKAHAAARAYCRERPGLSVKAWVSGLILDAVDQIARGVVVKRAMPLTEQPKPQTGPPVDPWTRPPFWAWRSKK